MATCETTRQSQVDVTHRTKGNVAVRKFKTAKKVVQDEGSTRVGEAKWQRHVQFVAANGTELPPPVCLRWLSWHRRTVQIAGVRVGRREARGAATPHQIQRLLHERVRFGPIFDFVWPSGVGPRVADLALMLINPYPWS
jgi:hypothetical protein